MFEPGERFGRIGDTATDTGAVPLIASNDDCPDDPHKVDPGFCGCGYHDLDLAPPAGPETCVHIGATVEGSVGVGAQVDDGAAVLWGAVLGDGAWIERDAVVAPKASVGADAVIGARTGIGRRADVGDRAAIGPDSALGRASAVGVDVDAAVGGLYMGYAASLGDRSRVLGTGVTLGNLVEVGPDSVLGAGVRLARASTIGAGTTIEAGTSIGAGVTLGADVIVGADSRIRRGVTVGDGAEIGRAAVLSRDVEIRPRARIGEGAVVRARAVVGIDAVVPPFTVVERGTVIPDAGVLLDEPPVVVITSPADFVDVDGGTVTLTGTVHDDGTIDALTLRVDEGAPTDVPFSGDTFTVTVSLLDGAQTIRIIARDDAGQEGSDRIFVSDCDVIAPNTKTWTGAVSTDWSDGGNWTPVGAPGSNDDVFVCGRIANQPALSGPVTVRHLYMDASARIDTAGFDVTIGGNLQGGAIAGTGTVHMTAAGNLRGLVPNLRIGAAVGLTGLVRATGDVTVDPGRRLHLWDRRLEVGGTLTQDYTGPNTGLLLKYARTQVVVEGDLVLHGSADAGSEWTHGEVRVRGNVVSTATARAWNPVVTLLVLDGTAPQTMSFAAAGAAGPGLARFTVENPAGVTISSGSDPLVVRGVLSVRRGGRLIADALDVDGAFLEVSEASDLTVHDVLDVAGRIDVRDLSSLSARVLHARREFVMEPTASAAGDDAYLYADLVVPSDDYDIARTHVRGAITLQAPWEHTLPHLIVDPGYRLVPAGNRMVLHGDFSQTFDGANQGLLLQNGADDVTIDGNVTVGGSGTMTTEIGLGILRITGNFTSTSTQPAWRPWGTLVRFEGTSAVSFAGTGASAFGDVVVAPGATATFTSDLLAEGSITVEGRLNNDPGRTTTILGDLTVNPGGTLDNAGVISVQGAYTNAGTLIGNAPI